jgi:type I site-specific restriction-modification system R (restriction) subunit
MKNESDLAIYQKQVVFIFDEAHRSQFGEAQKNLNKKFKKFYQFGFTGTPIFPQNALVQKLQQVYLVVNYMPMLLQMPSEMKSIEI